MLDACGVCFFIFFFKQKTAYELRISDWSSDVCSSDLRGDDGRQRRLRAEGGEEQRDAHVAGIGEGGGEGVQAGGAEAVAEHPARHRQGQEIGRASCRERVCQYV